MPFNPDGSYTSPTGITYSAEQMAEMRANPGERYQLDVKKTPEYTETTITKKQKSPVNQTSTPSVGINPDGSFTSRATGITYSKEQMQLQKENIGTAFPTTVRSTPTGIEVGLSYTVTQGAGSAGKAQLQRKLPQLSLNVGGSKQTIVGMPIFEKDPNPQQTQDIIRRSMYTQSIPDYKPLTSNIPGISYVKGFPDYVESKYPSILKDNPIGYASGKAVKGFVGIPSGIISAIDTTERYSRVALDQPATGEFTIAKMFSTKIQKQESEKYKRPMNLPQIMAYEGEQIYNSARSDPLGFGSEVIGSMLIAGGVTKAIGRTSELARTIKSKAIMVEEVGYEPNIGYPMNPAPTNPKTVLKSFEKNTLIPKPFKMSKSETVPYVPQKAVLPNTVLTGNERLMWTGHETGVPVGVGKTYTNPWLLTKDVSGMYGAPVAQTYYAKVETPMSEALKSMVGFDMSFGIGRKPTIKATTVSGIEAVPKYARNKIGGKEFIETKQKPGIAYADLYKSEYQTILGSGQELQVTGKNYYIKYGGIGKSHLFGRRIPIIEQRTTGADIVQLPKARTVNNVIIERISGVKQKSKSSYGSYDPFRPYEPTLNISYPGRPSKSISSYKQDSYSDINIYKSSIKPIKSTVKSSKSSTQRSSYKSTGRSTTSSIIDSLSGYKSSVRTTPSKSTTSYNTEVSSSRLSKITSTPTISSTYKPYESTKKYTSSSKTPYSSRTSSDESYTSSYKYKTPKYTTPPFPSTNVYSSKLPKYKSTTEPRRRQVDPTSFSLFGFKEKVKSRTPRSILGGDKLKLKVTPQVVKIAKRKNVVRKKKATRRKK